MTAKRRWGLWWKVLLCALVYFIAIAPTLCWPEISGDSEVLLAQTVLQMRHGGPWWLPMLGDAPRTNKPPLPAWITAAAVRPCTVANLSSTDPATRQAAYRMFAFEIRYPALLAACVALIATAWLASTLGGPRCTLAAMIICGSLFLFIRFIRVATTDVYLLTFVAMAHASFAMAIVQKRYRVGFLGGGAAVGLALMSKGPPALAETLAPLALYLLVRSRRESIRPMILPALAGLLVMLAIALPWPLSVLRQLPHEASNWASQLEGGGSELVSHDHWYSYISLIPNLLPWLLFFFAGTWLGSAHFLRARRIALAVVLLWLPIVIFSLFPLRKERYLLPMAGPAAVLCAYAVVLMRRTRPRYRPVEGTIWLVHWIIVIVLALGLPIAEAVALKAVDGSHWLPPPLAGIGAMINIALIVWGWRANRQVSLRPVIATAGCMLVANAMFLYGWSYSISGMSEMKPIADRFHAAFPGKAIAYYMPPGGDKPVTLDLDIYLDRPVPVMQQIPADGAIAGVLALRGADGAIPQLPGWKLWSELTTDKHHYHWCLYVMDNHPEPSAR